MAYIVQYDGFCVIWKYNKIERFKIWSVVLQLRGVVLWLSCLDGHINESNDQKYLEILNMVMKKDGESLIIV
jgi:hypothetical protein